MDASLVLLHAIFKVEGKRGFLGFCQRIHCLVVKAFCSVSKGVSVILFVEVKP